MARERICFATGLRVIEDSGEYHRIVFKTIRGETIVIMTPMIFNELARQIALGGHYQGLLM